MQFPSWEQPNALSIRLSTSVNAERSTTGVPDWLIDGVRLQEMLSTKLDEPYTPAFEVPGSWVSDGAQATIFPSGYLPIYYAPASTRWGGSGRGRPYSPVMGARIIEAEGIVHLLDLSWQDPHPGWGSGTPLLDVLSFPADNFYRTFAKPVSQGTVPRQFTRPGDLYEYSLSNSRQNAAELRVAASGSCWFDVRFTEYRRSWEARVHSWCARRIVSAHGDGKLTLHEGPLGVPFLTITETDRAMRIAGTSLPSMPEPGTSVS